MRFGSLFAGIGGLDLGLERAGMECVWQVEIDDYCSRVLTKHWPNVPKFRDVRECGKSNLEPVDLICGGFPCQPFSVAGKRRGTADDRHLWPEMLRIIDELRPTFVLGENVPGLIPMALDTVLDDLEACGYQARAITFPAASLGAWHQRDRLWIIGWNSNAVRCDWNSGEKREIQNEDSDANGVCEDVPDSISGRFDQRTERLRRQAGANADRESTQPIVANTIKPGLEERSEQELLGQCAATQRSCITADGCEDVPHAEREQSKGWMHRAEWRERSEGSIEADSWPRAAVANEWWESEPDVGRVANGVSRRVDRLRALGNAVVPQCAEFIGRMILKCHQKLR